MPVEPRRIRHRAVADSLSLRDWPFLFALTVGILLSLSLILMSRAEHPAIMKLRAVMTDITAPVIQLVGAPSSTLDQLSTTAQNWAFTYQQNAQLRSENEQLKQWRIAASALEAENKALQALLHFIPSDQPHFLSGRVIGQLANPFHSSPLLNIGSQHHVHNGMSVIMADGLVGRTIETAEQTSRILPITDINSRISVISEQTRERAIAVGQNTATLTLKFTPDDSQLQLGERLVTSGDGAFLPAGIPVGLVSAIHDNMVEVTPLIDWSRLDYVSLIQP